jgi:hypothetical protein
MMKRISKIMMSVALLTGFAGCGDESSLGRKITDAGGRTELAESGSGAIRRVVFDAESKPTAAVFEAMKGLPQLDSVLASGSPINDDDLGRIGALVGLTWLDLSRTKVTDAGLTHLTKLTRLQSLKLEGTSISDAGLASLAALEALEELDLSRTKVTDAGLGALAPLARLKTLRLDSNEVRGPGLEKLRPMAGLRTLSLVSNPLTDESLGNLAALVPLPGTRILLVKEPPEVFMPSASE